MLNKLAKFYATQIKLGKMTIDEVPAKVRELTRKLLTLLEAAGTDTSEERGEFAVLVAECSAHGCHLASENRR